MPGPVSTKLNETSPFAGKRHTERSAPLEVHTPWNKVGKPTDFGVKRSAGDFKENVAFLKLELKGYVGIPQVEV